MFIIITLLLRLTDLGSSARFRTPRAGGVSTYFSPVQWSAQNHTTGSCSRGPYIITQTKSKQPLTVHSQTFHWPISILKSWPILDLLAS